MIHHWKALVLFFRICKKNANLLKLIFFCKILLYSINICQKNVRKCYKYTFLKSPWPYHFKCAKKLQNLYNLKCDSERLKMWKFTLTGCLQMIYNNFFAKHNCAFCFLMSLAFQKANNYQNLTTESGSKQRFSLLQEKADNVSEDSGS